MIRLSLLAAFLAFVFPVMSRAQVVVPGVSSSLFEPEIDVVESGVKLDVQATVSADRKYVTMTMRPQNSQLLALHTFAFQTGNNVGGGVVGGVNPVAAGAGGAGGGAVVQQVNAPMKLTPGKGGLLLMQRGITPIVADR